jgi:hypothetical protein
MGSQAETPESFLEIRNVARVDAAWYTWHEDEDLQARKVTHWNRVSQKLLTRAGAARNPIDTLSKQIDGWR